MAKRSGTSGGADVKAFLNNLPGQISSEITSQSDTLSKEVADKIYDKSQEYVPYDTGELSSSGRVVKGTDGQYTVEYTAEHAFFVHENIPQDLPRDARNGAAKYGAEGNAKNYTTAGTSAKYLERAADEVANDREIVKYLRDALGRFKKKLPTE